MRAIRRFVVITLLLTIIVPAFGQMAGNPVGSRGDKEWTVGVMGNYFQMEQGDEQSISKRLLAKSDWGLTPWLDVQVMIGAVQLEMRSPRINVEDYHGKFKFAFGLGFQSQIPLGGSVQSPSLWFGGQALRFTSKGSYVERTELVTREFMMDYDWREFQVHAGMIVPYRFIRFYAAGVGWAVQRLDTKNEYIVYNDIHNYVGEEEGEYRSGIWTAGIIGVEFLLPSRYSIGIEMLYFNSYNYQIMVGLSQSGILTW